MSMETDITSSMAKTLPPAGGASPYLGIDGAQGVLADMVALGVLDPFAVRTQVIKSAVEAAAMLLRIDDILSGMKSKHTGGGGGGQPQEEGEGEGGAGGLED